jgi:hypothetical protein
VEIREPSAARRARVSERGGQRQRASGVERGREGKSAPDPVKLQGDFEERQKDRKIGVYQRRLVVTCQAFTDGEYAEAVRACRNRFRNDTAMGRAPGLPPRLPTAGWTFARLARSARQA